MKHKLSLALSLMMAACSDDAVDKSADGRAVYRLCDGSEGLRLALTTTRVGNEDARVAFAHPYGSRFLYVDGKCNFVTTADVPGELVTGTFSEAQGKSIATELNLEATRGVRYKFDGSCADFPAEIVRTPDAFLRSLCPNERPPAEVAAAFRWETTYALARSVGQPFRGAISVAVVPAFSTAGDATMWPFSFPVAEASLRAGATRGKTLTGADAVLARQLWASVPNRTSRGTSLPVLSNGERHDMLFRDELDQVFADEAAALTGLQPIARCEASRVLSSQLADTHVAGTVLTASIGLDAPCGSELCWDGRFDESSPVEAHVSLQRPVEPRKCVGTPDLGVSASLQPLIDAFQSSYPGASVLIDLGFGTLSDTDNEDIVCRALSVERCTTDARCLPISGRLNDATRQCTGPSVALGCGARETICTEAVTGGQAPDGRRAVFGNGCLPEGWNSFYGNEPDYNWPVCTP